jgi:hypothetical protein
MMMLSTILLLTTITTASAFAPASSSLSTSTSTALHVEKVPCFGAAPFPGDRSIFFGENYWNAITTEWGTEDTGTYVRAAYVKLAFFTIICTVLVCLWGRVPVENALAECSDEGCSRRRITPSWIVFPVLPSHPLSFYIVLYIYPHHQQLIQRIETRSVGHGRDHWLCLAKARRDVR